MRCVLFVLFVSAALSLFFSCADPPTELVVSPKQLDTLPPNPKDTSIHLIFAGDIMGHGPQIRAAEKVKNEWYDYTSCFEYIKPVLESADLAIGNLELTLPGEPPYVGYPYFRSHDDLGRNLKEAGFDVLMTSNNHCYDAKMEGLIHTIDVLQQNGLHQTGTFRSETDRAARYPLVIEKNYFKLAFLNYTYGVGRKSNTNPRLMNELDMDLIEYDVKTARHEGADFVIVMMHWGQEYNIESSSTQQRQVRALFRWGADLVVGAHPHVVQPIEERRMRSKSGHGKNVVVAYSLGNFISNQQKPRTDGSILLSVKLKKEKGKSIIADYSYIPIWRYIEKTDEATHFRVLPAADCENQANQCPDMPDWQRKKMNKHLQFLRSHLGEELEHNPKNTKLK